MTQITERIEREAVLVEDAALIRTMGMPVLEAVPSHAAPYERTDPFILVHEGRFSPSQMAGKDTKHPHRGFDNIWYVLKGAARTRSHHGSKRSDRTGAPLGRLTALAQDRPRRVARGFSRG